MKRVEVTRRLLDPNECGIYALAYMQVCTVEDAADDEILEVCNQENASGTRNGWTRVVRDGDEIPGMNPIQCDEYEDRKHFLVEC